MDVYQLIYWSKIREVKAFKSISHAKLLIINQSWLLKVLIFLSTSLTVVVSPSKFIVLQIHWLLAWLTRMQGDNPFGPLCECFACISQREQAMQFCFHGKRKSKKNPRRQRRCSTPTIMRPAFKLYWQPVIPCEYCHKEKCHHKFLNLQDSCQECNEHGRGQENCELAKQFNGIVEVRSICRNGWWGATSVKGLRRRLLKGNPTWNGVVWLKFE